jgi:hypothetical protein
VGAGRCENIVQPDDDDDDDDDDDNNNNNNKGIFNRESQGSSVSLVTKLGV